MQDTKYIGEPSKKLINSVYRTPHATQLNQGDLISFPILIEKLTPHNKKNLQTEVYPYFSENYQYGIVLNSDCDIVFEKNRRPKVKSVQIAAVVEASEHIKKMLGKQEHHDFGIIDEKTYGTVTARFESLINNQEKLYFYLPANEAINFIGAYIVRLDTSISLQIDTIEKYRAFIDSRLSASLEDPFKAKLGENFASLFDRIGTDDVEEILGEADYTKWLTAELERYFIPIKDDIYKRAIVKIRQIKKGDADLKENVRKIIEESAIVTASTFKDNKIYLEIERIVKGNASKQSERIMEQLRKSTIIHDFFLENGTNQPK
jgi:hypothetical protein